MATGNVFLVRQIEGSNSTVTSPNSTSTRSSSVASRSSSISNYLSSTLHHSSSTNSRSSSAITTSSNITVTTCPASYPTTPTSVAFTTLTGCDSIYGFADGDGYWDDVIDLCVKSYCYSGLSSLSRYYDSHKVTGWVTTTQPRNSGILGTGTLSDVVVAQSIWTETYSREAEWFDLFTPVPPCCGHCTLAAQTIQLIFWSDQGATATALNDDVVTLVDPDSGFTFTSPSVYIAFTTLGATDQCGVVGEIFYNTTIALDASEISTVQDYITTKICTFYDPDYPDVPPDIEGAIALPPPRQINWADLRQNCSTIAGYYYLTDAFFNAYAGDDPCHPVIAIPDRIKNMQAAWATCEADYNGGFYDPPKTLTQGGMLVPTTAAPASSPPTIAPPTKAYLLLEATQTSSVVYPPSSLPSYPDPPALPSSKNSADPSSSAADQGSSVRDPASPSSADPVDPPSSVADQGTSVGDPTSSAPPSYPSPVDPADPAYSVGDPGSSIGDPKFSAPPASSLPIFVVGSTTLVPGGETVTVAGTPIFIPSGGSDVIVGTSTLVLTLGTVDATAAATSETLPLFTGAAGGRKVWRKGAAVVVGALGLEWFVV